MTDCVKLQEALINRFGGQLQACEVACDEVTITIVPEYLLSMAEALKEEKAFLFKCLIDVCGVDYLHYGLSEWDADKAPNVGFDRGVARGRENMYRVIPHHGPRFAVVYHLLSLSLNQRLRVKVFLPEESHLVVESVTGIWAAANWFEREAFDLYGIIFNNHPDLRRILTDYGFIGHPFRKDFPLSGHVEVRYDATEGRVIYEPVQIEDRILEPKVIRIDSRYHDIAPKEVK